MITSTSSLRHLKSVGAINFTAFDAIDASTEKLPAANFRFSAGKYAIDVTRNAKKKTAFERLNDDAAQHPEWFDQLDLLDADACSNQQLDDMIESAPTQFSRGMLFGKKTLRIQQFVLTGQNLSSSGSKNPETEECLRRIDSNLAALGDVFEEWFTQHDHVNPDFCSRAELESLMKSAPVPFLEGLMYGKLTMRMQMAVLPASPI